MGTRAGARLPGGARSSATSSRPPSPRGPSPELDARRARLRALAPRSGYLVGDSTRGGAPATFVERVLLAGRQRDGAPRGLRRCPDCGEYRGRCLDPSPDFAGRVLDVHCRCANDNRCAACGHLLYERRLNANLYDERDGRVWHVPGFCGLDHVCVPTPAEATHV